MSIKDTLLSNPEFVLLAKRGVSASVLWDKFQDVKVSHRRMREIAAIAREPSERLPPIESTVSVSPYKADINRPMVKEFIENLPSRKIDFGSIPINTRKKFSVPVSTMRDADTFPELEGDWAIISDLHIPYHNSKVLECFLEEAYAANIRQFLIVGDFLDSNQVHPVRGMLSQHGRRYQDDLKMGDKILGVFMEAFPDGGWITSGNHDEYVVRTLRNEIDRDWMFSKFYHQYPKIKWSNYEQCRIRSGNAVIRACHGANYSASNPLAVAQALSAKFEESIVMGHQHMNCSGWNKSGTRQCVCMGSAMDAKKLSYLNASPKINPQQTNGFVLLKDGFMTVYDNQELFR